MENERLVAREIVKSADIHALEQALHKIVLHARGEYPNWMGLSATHVEDADGMNAHSFELIEETLSDQSKQLVVRLLFVGDIGNMEENPNAK